jgi:hypothetical protein
VLLILDIYHTHVTRKSVSRRVEGPLARVLL